MTITQEKVKTNKDLILEKLEKISPSEYSEILNFLEYLDYKTNKPSTETETYEEKQKRLHALSLKYAGCLDGGPGDLSYNKKYFELRVEGVKHE